MDVFKDQQLASPDSFLQNIEKIPPSDQFPPPNSLPLQEAVSSASRIPNPPSKLRLGYRHLASPVYVEEFQELIDILRQAHTKDRKLWQREREELHERICELERELRLLRSGQENATLASVRQLSNANLAALSGKRIPRNTEAESTGREFWRGLGGMNDTHPTRTFSESSSASAFSNVRLQSISEDLDSTVRKQNIGFSVEGHPLSPVRHAQRLPSIPGDRVDANLDGISFKPSGLPASVVKSILPSIDSSPSPMHSPSPLTSLSPPPKPAIEPRPKLLDLPSSLLTADELRLEDAGHTPLARVVADASSDASSATTPTSKVPEIERPPLEPYPTRAILRPPHERRDSYFPEIPESADEDPALQEPLTLTNDKGGKEDQGFLSVLDSKLRQAQRSTSFDFTSQVSDEETSVLQRAASHDGMVLSNGATETKHDYDDSEPKLRMKTSTLNFGAPFGAEKCGNNI